MRLYNYLKNTLNLTKSELSKYILENEITVNDKVIPISSTICDTDIIKINGSILENVPFIYYLYYKPRGILSTVSLKKESYINNINTKYKVTPAGRLDKESEGLMILSNDGAFINLFTGDKFIHEKEYIVKLKNKIDDNFILGMSKSYILDNRETKPAIVKMIDDYTISIILYEGIYHQIRRLVKINKNSVLELKRIRIGNYNLGNMKPGDLIEIKP